MRYYGTSYLSRRGMDDEDLDFGLFGRDAEPDLDLETALLRRDIITAVDSMLMRRGNKYVNPIVTVLHPSSIRAPPSALSSLGIIPSILLSPRLIRCDTS